MKEIEYEEDKKVISYDEAMGKLEKGRLPQDTLSALVDMKMDLGAVAGDVETDLGKEIRKYTDAINTLMASNSSTKPKVEKALTTISGLKEFLGKGKGENAYQTIVRVGEDTGNLSKENFDNGIKALSDFYGLGIDLNELNKTAVQDMKVEKVETVEDFRKLQSKPETFLNVKFKDYSTVTKMTSTLSVISSNLEDVANSKNAIRNDEDRQERENAALIAREINKFNEAVNILRRNKTSDNYDDDTIKEALDTVRGFKSFLTDGEGQTNYQKINELINNHPKLEKDVKKGTNAMTKGLSAIDQALNCGLNPKELGAAKARPKTVKKEEEKLENREENKLVFEKYDYALNWINAKKAEFKKNPASVKNNPNYPVNFIVEIMAARDISNARRGEISTLKQGMMTQKDIENRCALLMDHGQFSAFINNMKTDRKFLAKAEEAAMSSPGHGESWM